MRVDWAAQKEKWSSLPFGVLVCQNAARLAQRGTFHVATFRRLAIFYQIMTKYNRFKYLMFVRHEEWSLCRLRRSCGFDERGSGWLLSDAYVARKSGLGFGIGIFGNEFHVRFSRRFGLQEYIQRALWLALASVPLHPSFLSYFLSSSLARRRPWPCRTRTMDPPDYDAITDDLYIGK